jgi:hypothetical protein
LLLCAGMMTVFLGTFTRFRQVRVASSVSPRNFSRRDLCADPGTRYRRDGDRPVLAWRRGNPAPPRAS